jgi:hypothetical protein
MKGVGGSRRLRALLATSVLVAAAGASVVVANVLATRTAVRYDVTATGEHRLSPRAAGLLAGLSGEYRVVVVAERRAVDAASMQRALDVLDRFKSASAKITVTIIDPTTASGQESHGRLVSELVSREAGRAKEHQDVLAAGTAQIREVGRVLGTTLSSLMLDASKQVPGGAGSVREGLEQRAAASRVMSQDLAAATEESQVAAALAWTAEGGGVPQLEGPIASLAERGRTAAAALGVLAKDMAQLADAASTPAGAKTLARSAAEQASMLRDRVAQVADRLGRVPRLDIDRVSDALAASTAVVVVGPEGKGLSAIDPEALFWPGGVGANAAEARGRAEELLTTAIAAIESPIKPIFVLVHAEPRAFLEKVPLLDVARRRLESLGIDVVEWAIVPSPEAPELSGRNPKGDRPVVYAVFSPASWAGSGESGAGGLSGAERSVRLSKVVDGLMQRGAAILMSLNPSPMPGYGEPDPLARSLSTFGLTVDSSRPLLRDRQTPSGRLVDTDLTLRAEQGEHAILRAMGTLPVYVPWALAIGDGEAAARGVRVWPLVRALGDERTWAESQWLRLMQTPRDRRMGLTDLPTFDAGKDSNSGPWTVAAAAERTLSDGQRERLVVVGSNSWYVDQVLGAEESVDGRTVRTYSGNGELFESAVWWLAGQEQMISRSEAAASVALVKPLSAETLWRLRLLLIAGVPLVILGAGVAHRMIFG